MDVLSLASPGWDPGVDRNPGDPLRGAHRRTLYQKVQNHGEVGGGELVHGLIQPGDQQACMICRDSSCMLPDDSIQSMGGKARSEALSAEQKKEIAKMAAEATWGARPLRATHRGSFKEEFGIDVECYVLADEQKMAVLSERGMGRALGLSSSGGNKLGAFLGSKVMSERVGPELRGKPAKPMNL